MRPQTGPSRAEPAPSLDRPSRADWLKAIVVTGHNELAVERQRVWLGAGQTRVSRTTAYSPVDVRYRLKIGEWKSSARS